MSKPTYTHSRSSHPWLTPLGAGVSVMIFSWLLSFSGCRIGNRVEENSQTDTVSGYYETKPYQLQMCAGISGVEECGAINSTTPVPAFLDEILINPTWLLVASRSKKIAYLTPPGGEGRYLPVQFGDDGTMVLPPSRTDAVQARNDPSCVRYKEITLEGTFARSAGPFETQTAFVPVGRLAFLISVEDLFVPACTNCSCTSTMQEFQDCYQDVTRCGSSSNEGNAFNQMIAKEIFDPYVNAGIIRADQISRTTGFSYTVDYR